LIFGRAVLFGEAVLWLIQSRLSRELSQALMEPILGQFNITTRQTMANSSKNPNADDRGPPDQSFVGHRTKWKKKPMDGATGAEVQRARADWRPYGIFPRVFSRHRCVPRENRTIFGILATRAQWNGVAWLKVFAQTQLKLKSLRSNRRAQAKQLGRIFREFLRS
jgi:hypothetical protein